MSSKIRKGIQAAVYWLIHATWACPTFVIGLLVALFLLVTGHKPHVFGFAIYFEVGFVHGAGCEFGPFFVLGEDCTNDLRLKCHEHGHGIQSLWLGPFMLIVVSAPSLARFWYRDHKEKSMSKKLREGKISITEYNEWLASYPDYDDIWFEGQATRLGLKYLS